jgi:hypothetical protein
MRPSGTPSVDEALVPVRQFSVHAVELDGEIVLLDEVAQRLHLLSTTGALVWACLDGESSVGDIVTDLTEELGVSRGIVLADVLAMVGRLVDEGLLANGAPVRSDERDKGVEPASPAEAS